MEPTCQAHRPSHAAPDLPATSAADGRVNHKHIPSNPAMGNKIEVVSVNDRTGDLPFGWKSAVTLPRRG